MTSRARLEPAFVVPLADKSRIPPRSLGNNTLVVFAPTNKLIETRIAVMYESQLKEAFLIHDKSPSRERVNQCFVILDDINPYLGSFGPLIKTIQEELQKSVYSNSLTSTADGKQLEKIPYFTALQRIKDLKRGETTKIQETFMEMQQKLKFRDHDITILQKKNLSLKQEISDLMVVEGQLKTKISDLEVVIENAKLERERLNNFHIDCEQELKKDIESMHTNLAQANHIIEKLTVFKTSYNQSENENSTDEERDARKQTFVIEPQGMVEYDLYQIKKMDEQLLEIMNSQIDDFEISLGQLRKKKEILSGVGTSSIERDAAYQLELAEVNASFKKRLSELLQERDLLKRHSGGLQIAFSKHKNDKQLKTVKRMADDALRKYAVILHYSRDNGRSFDAINEVSFCNKCSSRTIVCPHRTVYPTSLRLPSGTTHLKFLQPSLRVKATVSKSAYENVLNAKLLEETNEEILEENEDEVPGVTRAFLKIWGDYYDNRNGYKATLHRSISSEKLRLLIQEVYDARWALEEHFLVHGNFEEGLPSFADVFHGFMKDRYQIEIVAHKATHDVISELQILEGQNEHIDMFIHHMSGEKDIMWKYFMLLRKLLLRYETFDIYRFRQVIQVLYPLRSKENYDHIELEFISYSKNRVTREMVEDHIIHLIQSSIEPNYRFFYKALKKFDFQDRGFLTFDDFDETLSQILPSISRKEKRLRYKQVESLTRENAVPLERLAQISSCFMLYAAYSNRWISANLISREFMDTYFKDGFEDDNHSEASDEEDDDLLDDEFDQMSNDNPDSDQKREGLYGATEEQIEQEAAKLLESLSK